MSSEPQREAIDLILLTYNRVDYLEQMVDGIERNTEWPYRLTIVDNVSGPRTRQWLRTNADRFHQIIWNGRNEHLAGYQRGIAATQSKRFVLSDADLVPHAPTADGCWLTRLVEISERHPDFALIGARLDSVSEARNAHFERAPMIDDELIEASTGVWLNLIRREALRVPYLSDGITCYALRRAGYRVGVASEVYCVHLGDKDPELHPAYLAGKQSAKGFGTVYPSYPELEQAGRPPSMEELLLAAPVLAALEQRGVRPTDTVELSVDRWPPLKSAAPQIESCVRGLEVAAAKWSYSGEIPLQGGGARAVALVSAGPHDQRLLADAFATAAEWVALLTSDPSPEPAHGWRLERELPGPQPVLHKLARIAGRWRWRRTIGYSTNEERGHWLEMLALASFGEQTPLRLYLFRRIEPLELSASRWRARAGGDASSPGPYEELRSPSMPQWRRPLERRGRFTSLLTKAHRLVRVEWLLRRR